LAKNKTRRRTMITKWMRIIALGAYVLNILFFWVGHSMDQLVPKDYVVRISMNLDLILLVMKYVNITGAIALLVIIFKRK